MSLHAEDLRTPPLYTLKLSGAQRSLLDWLEAHGALFSPLLLDVEQAAQDCEISPATVYEAIDRLERLNLVTEHGGRHKLNPRFFFSAHPEIAQLAAEAFDAPQVTPDARAAKPRRMSPEDARRRRTIRPVEPPAEEA